MNYNFDKIINRCGTNSVKYDFARERGKPEDVLPMWVADMDFPVPPEILEDIQKAAGHGIYGYTEPKDGYYDAVAGWFGSRFGYRVRRGEIVKAPGVVFALAQAIRALTQPGAAVMVQTPVYYPFYNVIQSNGRELVTSPLVYSRDAQGGGRYLIDFDDFERKITINKTKMFILCSPHNPVGRVWTRGELEKMRDICEKHGVIVVSDEIHCDFVWSSADYSNDTAQPDCPERSNSHTCFGLLSDDAVIATAPSKTFNLAGLQCSNIFVKNKEFRGKLIEEINRTGYGQLSTLGIAACQSAYTKGAAWLEELCGYLAENIRLVREFTAGNLPKVKLVEPEGTYLLWLDFSALEMEQTELDRRITHGAKLWLNSGTVFGADGDGFMRMNIACPREVVETALMRLKKEFG